MRRNSVTETLLNCDHCPDSNWISTQAQTHKPSGHISMRKLFGRSVWMAGSVHQRPSQSMLRSQAAFSYMTYNVMSLLEGSDSSHCVAFQGCSWVTFIVTQLQRVRWGEEKENAGEIFSYVALCYQWDGIRPWTSCQVFNEYPQASVHRCPFVMGKILCMFPKSVSGAPSIHLEGPNHILSFIF